MHVKYIPNIGNSIKCALFVKIKDGGHIYTDNGYSVVEPLFIYLQDILHESMLLFFLLLFGNPHNVLILELESKLITLALTSCLSMVSYNSK